MRWISTTVSRTWPCTSAICASRGTRSSMPSARRSRFCAARVTPACAWTSWPLARQGHESSAGYRLAHCGAVPVVKPLHAVGDADLGSVAEQLSGLADVGVGVADVGSHHGLGGDGSAAPGQGLDALDEIGQ